MHHLVGHISGNHQPAVGRAIVRSVEILQNRACNAVVINKFGVSPVRVGAIHHLVHRIVGQNRCFCLIHNEFVLAVGQHGFQLRFRINALFNQLAEQRQQLVEVLVQAEERDCRVVEIAVGAQLGAVKVECVGNLLSRVVPRAAHQHCVGC